MEDKQQFAKAEKDGHALRSKLLDEFARIESWVAGKALEIGEKPSKASLGQKIKSIRTNESKFKYPKRISSLADRIEAAILLRNDVVHAVLETLLDKSGNVHWLFENVGIQDSRGERLKLILTQATFDIEISALKNLVKELNDQKLSAPTPTAPASTTG
jgi:hypothetical protein